MSEKPKWTPGRCGCKVDLPYEGFHAVKFGEADFTRCSMHASAPDLYAALEDLLRVCTGEHPEIGRAREALRKARGES